MKVYPREVNQLVDDDLDAFRLAASRA